MCRILQGVNMSDESVEQLKIELEKEIEELRKIKHEIKLIGIRNDTSIHNLFMFLSSNDYASLMRAFRNGTAIEKCKKLEEEKLQLERELSTKVSVSKFIPCGMAIAALILIILSQ